MRLQTYDDVLESLEKEMDVKYASLLWPVFWPVYGMI